MGATISVGEKSKSITDVVKSLQEELDKLKNQYNVLLDENNTLLNDSNELLRNTDALLTSNNELLNANNELLQNFDPSNNNNSDNNEELNAIIDQLKSDIEAVVLAYNDLESAYGNLEETYVSSEKTYTMVSENTEFGTKTYKEILKINFVPESTTETTGARIKLTAIPSSDFLNNWDGDSSTIPGKTGEQTSVQETVVERKEFVVFENTEDNSDKIALTLHFVADGETEYDVYNATDLYHIVKDENDTTVNVTINE